MFIAIRDLKFAKGRFLLMALVVALVAFLTTLLSGLAAGLIKNNISGLIELDVTHLAFECPRWEENAATGKYECQSKPSYRNSMLERDMWEDWRARAGVLAAEPMGHTMFNARTVDDDPLDEVVLWGIEPGSFLEPSVLEGEKLSANEQGVIITKLLVDRGLQLGDTFVLDRVQTRLTVVGIADEFNIGHVPIVYTPIRKWSEATYGPPGGPPPGEKLPSILYDFATVIALQMNPEATVEQMADIDAELGTRTIDKNSAYEASSGYLEEIATVVMIQWFLIIISAVVIGAFFTVWTIQRSREIGLVKALGGSNGYLLRDALGQVLILMLVGVVLGNAAVPAALWGIEQSFGTTQLFTVNIETAASSSTLLVIAGLLGSAISIRLITRIDPIIALGTER
jgi:putative ABC transport system permease protein